jgi:hypothetical protein
MYDDKLGVAGYQEGVNKLQAKLDDPNTPQGEVREISNRLNSVKHFLEIAKREEYEAKNKVSVYGSDDYVGANAGDMHFYFGYEVTKCPVKSHKTDDDCYQKDCDKREWVFQVTKCDKVVFEMLDSEIAYPQADDIERKLIVGMAHYIKSLGNK